jgi:hypothetical protein
MKISFHRLHSHLSNHRTAQERESIECERAVWRRGGVGVGRTSCIAERISLSSLRNLSCSFSYLSVRVVNLSHSREAGMEGTRRREGEDQRTQRETEEGREGVDLCSRSCLSVLFFWMMARYLSLKFAKDFLAKFSSFSLSCSILFSLVSLSMSSVSKCFRVLFLRVN